LVEWSFYGPLPANHNTIDHAVVTWKEYGTFREDITYPSPGDVLGRSMSIPPKVGWNWPSGF
jgi:hypothetical protein